MGAGHVLDTLCWPGKAVVEAHGRPEAGKVPTVCPVASAMVPPAEGPVLLDDVCATTTSGLSGSGMKLFQDHRNASKPVVRLNC